MTRDPDCLFCKIVHGEIPAAKVMETDQALAFLDINPLNHGHVLVVPRDHHANLLDLPDPLAAHTASLLPRLARAVKQATGATGLNIVLNIGEVAGQTIDHIHWHVIPRFQGDPVHWPWPQGRYVGDELNQMQHSIQQALNLSDNVG
ncbi:MAG: HIT family protein [Isosphaeraceae bacterium]